MRFFKEEKREKVLSLGYTVTQYSHQTGATLVHIHADTPERAFCVAFKTIPWDDTGVFHILEHSCLSGSESYPIGSPILYMMKNSMQTYLNAITFQGKTMYPCASCNSKDFENLMQVYLDAAFHPLLEKETFFREGWHLEEKDIRGVVYNEMQGALSSLDAQIYQALKADLYPDTYQRFCSGGQPAAIPKLRYEEFLAVHRRHYSAGNCVLCLRGDFAPEEYERLLHEALMAAPAGGNALPYDRQQYNGGTYRHSYAIGEGEESAGRTALLYSYNVGDYEDGQRLFAMSLLMQYLMENQNAPLMKALLDTKLLKDARYLFSQERQAALGLAIYHTEEGCVDQIGQVVEATVARVVRTGVDKQFLRASLAAMNFRTKENALQVRGRALEDFAQVCSNLFYDLPVAQGMDPDILLNALEAALDTDYYEQLLQQVFLENPITARSVLKPQPQAAGAAHCETVRKLLGELKEGEEAAITAVLQPKQDTPQALAKMPRLTLADLQSDLRLQPFCPEGRLLYTQAETAGIVYLRYYFSMEGLSEEECMAASLLSNVLTQLPTQESSVEQLSKRIRTQVGMLNFYPTAIASSAADAQPWFMVGVSCLEKNLPQVMSLVQEILLQTCYDAAQATYVLTSTYDSLHRGFVQNGMAVAQNRSGAGQFLGARYLDLFGGWEYLQFVQQCAREPEKFCHQAQALAQKLFCNSNLIYVGITGGSMPQNPVLRLPEGKRLTGAPVALAKGNVGYAVASGVHYNAASVAYGDLLPFSGKHLVVAKLLSLGYLWRQIREVGGAYGTFLQFGRNGRLLLSSYRDPHMAQTVQVFRGIAEFLQTHTWTDQEILGAIISVVAEMTNPQMPAAVGVDNEIGYLTGYSQQDRRQVLQQVCEFKKEDMALFVPIFCRLAQEMDISSVGSRDKLQQAGVFAEILTV